MISANNYNENTLFLNTTMMNNDNVPNCTKDILNNVNGYSIYKHELDAEEECENFDSNIQILESNKNDISQRDNLFDCQSNMLLKNNSTAININNKLRKNNSPVANINILESTKKKSESKREQVQVFEEMVPKNEVNQHVTYIENHSGDYFMERGNSMESDMIRWDQNKDYSVIARNKTYDSISCNKKSKRFAERNIPTLKDEIIRYLENDKKKNKKKINKHGNPDLKKFLGKDMQIDEKQILEYLLENEHFDPKKRETLRNFFLNQKNKQMNELCGDEGDIILKILQSEARDNRETLGGYLMQEQNKSIERPRNCSIGSECKQSVYEKLNCDNSFITKRNNSLNQKNYKSVSNIFVPNN